MTILLALGLLLALFVGGWLITRGLPERPEKKVNTLEGIRGYAAFIVVIYHFFVIYFPAFITGEASLNQMGFESYVPFTPFCMIYSGQLAVALFFVLSGFVLSYRFLQTGNRQIVLSSAARRYPRLMIPILSTSLVYWILFECHAFHLNGFLTNPFIYKWWMHLQVVYPPSLVTFLKQSMFWVFMKDFDTFNLCLWTMKFEWVGSILVFLILLIFGSSRWRYVGYGLGIIGFFHKPFFLAFILGILLSDLSVHQQLNKLKRPLISMPILLTGLYLAFFSHGVIFHGPGLTQLNGTMFAWMQLFLTPQNYEIMARLFMILSSTLLLTWILITPSIHAVFSNKVGRFLGEVSFSLYLLHFAILCSLTPFLAHLFFPSLGYVAAVWLSFIISLGVIFLLSYIFYLYIDRAAVEFSKQVYNLALNWFRPKPSLPTFNSDEPLG